MNWLKTRKGGSVVSAGTRPGNDQHNGNAVMYDARAGKILTFGGSQAFALPEFGATGTTVVITIKGAKKPVQTKKVGSLNKARVYGNGIILPDGKVAVVGGAQVPKEFNDDTAIFDPGALPNT